MEEKLLTGIAGGRTLRELCRELQVGRATVYSWMKDDDFAHRMAWARARSASMRSRRRCSRSRTTAATTG